MSKYLKKKLTQIREKSGGITKAYGAKPFDDRLKYKDKNIWRIAGMKYYFDDDCIYGFDVMY